VTPEEIGAKREELETKLGDLQRQIEHVKVDMDHLYLECDHPERYSTNTMGRDPGGAYCPDCGKHW
jgi:hypothetical protein